MAVRFSGAILKDGGEFGLGLSRLSELHQGTPERHPGGQIPGMAGEPCTADLDRLAEVALAAGVRQPAGRTQSTPGPSGPGVGAPRCGIEGPLVYSPSLPESSWP